MTLVIFYVCGLCDSAEHAVEVQGRESDAVPVTDWLDSVVRRAMVHHAATSPGCQAGKFRQIKIPTEGRAWIGGPIQQ